MRIWKINSLLLATVFSLTACGGGGGGVSAISTVPPPTPPPPPLQLIPAAATSQQFAVAGSSHLTSGDSVPRLGAADQLQVRYVASSNSYEVELPNSQTWIALPSKSEVEASGGGVNVVRQLGRQYSSVIEWWNSSKSPSGVEGIGIATPAADVPVTGSATYSAIAYGTTPERHDGFQLVNPHVMGPMTLTFNFAQGSLSGSLSPFLDPEWHDYPLATLTFRETVYSTGSTTFSGKFATDLSGVNSFSGLFTGPNAQELIGNFAFPYLSPIDGQTYQADGAFVGGR